MPVGTLRDWEQARVSSPDFAVAYVTVIGKCPEMVARAVGWSGVEWETDDRPLTQNKIAEGVTR